MDIPDPPDTAMIRLHGHRDGTGATLGTGSRIRSRNSHSKNTHYPAHRRKVKGEMGNRTRRINVRIVNGLKEKFVISKTIRQVKRYREILSVCASWGFGEFIAETRLDELVDKGRRLLKPGTPERERQPREVRIRKAFEELGPTFMKLGQVLSTRPDLVPPSYAKEFRRLQDQCPPVPFDAIKKTLESELGDALTEHVADIQEDPIGTASLGQAHLATLKDGRKVVLKVLRPGIDRVIESDLDILKEIASLISARFENIGFDPKVVVREFSRALEHELDLTHEGRSTDRLREDFKGSPDATFPEVFWELTSHHVLCVEYIQGVLLSKWEDAGLTDEQRREIVIHGTAAVFRQTLEMGFFHADPHPGNLFALPDNRICFIDCGMTGHVDEEDRRDLGMLLHGVATSDLDMVVSAFLRLGNVDDGDVDVRSLRRDMQDFLDQYANTEASQIDMGGVLNSFLTGLRVHHIECPGDLILMIKALTTIEGVATELDPTFDLIAAARPHLERLVRSQYSPSAIKRRLRKAGMQYMELLEEMPGDVQRLVRRVQSDRFRIHLEHRGTERFRQTLEHASRNVALSVIVASFMVASSILILADHGDKGLVTIFGVVGFASAFTLTLIAGVMALRAPRSKM